MIHVGQAHRAFWRPLCAVRKSAAIGRLAQIANAQPSGWLCRAYGKTTNKDLFLSLDHQQTGKFCVLFFGLQSDTLLALWRHVEDGAWNRWPQ